MGQHPCEQVVTVHVVPLQPVTLHWYTGLGYGRGNEHRWVQEHRLGLLIGTVEIHQGQLL
jgi:hypothetical protein